MSDAFISVVDIMDSDPKGSNLKPIRDDLLNMDMDIRRQMDRGLTPAEMDAAQSARQVIQAAAHILDKLSA